MAAPLPPLAQRLAAELADEISRVKEPYRTNLRAWINNLAGQEIIDLPFDLSVWLAGLGGPLMLEQYALIRKLCKEAKRYFGLSEKRKRRR